VLSSNVKSDASSIIDFLDDTNENIILDDTHNPINKINNNSLEGPGIIQSVYIPAQKMSKYSESEHKNMNEPRSLSLNKGFG
jgi:hypothetical protein